MRGALRAIRGIAVLVCFLGPDDFVDAGTRLDLDGACALTFGGFGQGDAVDRGVEHAGWSGAVDR